MKKIFVISLILFLVSFTTIIKNSTKKIDEDIFSTRENIRNLNKELTNIKLEFEYLSSSEKLLEFQNLYFDDELIQKDINEIQIIYESMNRIKTKQFEIISK